MQISNNLNHNINFQKKLQANCAVLKDGKPIDCKIYQLEYGKDDNYFADLQNTVSWMSGIFTDGLDELIKDKNVSIEDTYVIEDENEKCLGYCEIKDEDPYELDFNFLEAIPKGIFNYDYKYIGETLLAFMAKRAKTESRESIVAETVIKRAKPFYEKNNFMLIRNTETWGVDGFLDEEYYDEILDKNKSHTTKSIELIG